MVVTRRRLVKTWLTVRTRVTPTFRVRACFRLIMLCLILVNNIHEPKCATRWTHLHTIVWSVISTKIGAYFIKWTQIEWVRFILRGRYNKTFPTRRAAPQQAVSIRTTVCRDRTRSPTLTPRVVWRGRLRYRERYIGEHAFNAEGGGREDGCDTEGGLGEDGSGEHGFDTEVGSGKHDSDWDTADAIAKWMVF